MGLVGRHHDVVRRGRRGPAHPALIEGPVGGAPAQRGAITQPEGQAAIQQELDRSVEQMNLPADQAEQMRTMMDGMLPALATTAAVFGVLAFLVYLWVAFAIRGGSRAARIVGTVLASLSVLVLVSNAVMGAFSPLDLVWVGLGVAGIVLAYRPDATEYMRLKAWQRFARR